MYNEFEQEELLLGYVSVWSPLTYPVSSCFSTLYPFFARLQYLLMGLMLTLLIIQNPRESRIFFEGPSEDDEDYLPLMTIVLLFPSIELVIGGLWSVMAWFP